jgi:hypothetical protein
MASILDSMGWEFTEIDYKDLRNLDLLSQYNAVFINCARAFADVDDDEANAQTDPIEWSVAQASVALEQYVRNGGTLYASDWAYTFINRGMPGYLTFPEQAKIGSEGVVQVDVKDPGLAAVLGGSTVPINFDLGAWVPIQGVSDKVKVYLTLNDWQLAASFPYGQGKVIYTAFHNQKQTTDQEKQLLEYLVLLTTTEGMSADLQTSMAAAGHQAQQELLGTIRAGGTSERYTLPNRSASHLAVGLDWQAGTMRLTVFKPDGSVYAEQEGPPPLIVDIPDAKAGNWSFEVQALDVPPGTLAYTIQIDSSTPLTTATNGSGSSRTLTYVVIGFGLCLCGLLAVALIVGVIFIVRRRKA